MRNTSPTIDKLARQGVIFTNFIAPSSHTSSSNASLVTSTYPNVHGVKDWGYQFSQKISKTLPMILKEHGYNTAFISDQLALTLIKGFERGFNTFNTIYSFTFDRHRERLIDITDWAISWLRDNKYKKFFLWVYYLSPHGPYIPYSPYDKMFVHDKYYNINKNIPISDDYFLQSPIGTIPRYLAIDDTNDVDYYISQYDAEIRRVDNGISRLLEELKKGRLDKNTIIIINSDHGEALGEHDRYFCHNNSLYDELIRIPLIISWDKKIPFGIKIDKQVRTIDLMPTILNILKIKFGNMQGQSFLPLIMNRTDNFPSVAYSEWLDLVSVRTKKWKLIYNQNNMQYELYDLENDPKERNIIVNKEIGIFKFLRFELDKYLFDSGTEGKPIKSVIRPEVKEKLRALGYAQ
jgi:arylsulfatase A-like enzyme